MGIAAWTPNATAVLLDTTVTEIVAHGTGRYGHSQQASPSRGLELRRAYKREIQCVCNRLQHFWTKRFTGIVDRTKT